VVDAAVGFVARFVRVTTDTDDSFLIRGGDPYAVGMSKPAASAPLLVLGVIATVAGSGLSLLGGYLNLTGATGTWAMVLGLVLLLVGLIGLASGLYNLASGVDYLVAKAPTDAPVVEAPAETN